MFLVMDDFCFTAEPAVSLRYNWTGIRPGTFLLHREASRSFLPMDDGSLTSQAMPRASKSMFSNFLQAGNGRFPRMAADTFDGGRMARSFSTFHSKVA